MLANMQHSNIDFLSIKKPTDIIVPESVWKYTIRCILKNKNLLVIGPTRCGKTYLVRSAAKALGRLSNFYTFNIGSTQDARSSLIGNTHFSKENGTFFNKNTFVHALTTPKSIILLDELTRGSDDAWNILMPILDSTQRFFRIEESLDKDPIPLASEVSIIASANIGIEYTSTKVLDKALNARFPCKIEMKPLGYQDEYDLIKYKFPDIDPSQKSNVETILKIAQELRIECKKPSPKISNYLNTESVIEMVDLLLDGFSLLEIADVCIYPEFTDEGNVAGERAFVKMTVQKHIPSAKDSATKNPTINTHESK